MEDRDVGQSHVEESPRWRIVTSNSCNVEEPKLDNRNQTGSYDIDTTLRLVIFRVGEILVFSGRDLYH